MRRASFILSAATLIVLVIIGSVRVGPLPPLGPLLDPVHGIWSIAATAELPRDARGAIPGLRDSVRVLYDDRSVPHIFARSVEDAYRALGYVVARDRLFQLEIQTRATAGTLTELVGPRALPADRSQRALGLAWSAEREWAALDSTSVLARAMRAYADGVNAWIDGLSQRELPVEYHLLNAWPMRWEPQYSLYLLRRMGQTLAYNDDELVRAALAARVGDSAADAFMPIHSPIQEPIVPGGGPYPRSDFHRLAEPRRPALGLGPTRRAPVSRLRAQPPTGAEAVPAGHSAVPFELPQPRDGEDGDRIGSNNWAVSPRRSATHDALLAGDPHLDLTLPSIWYEAHLAVPGSLDVYGVTIPAVPGIVIGFNRDVAWSFTNTGADVLDRYAEQLDDAVHPSRYQLDGAWERLERRIERYEGPRGTLLAVDTLYQTHRGPLSRSGDAPTSMRWTVLERGSSLALLGIQRATNVDEWLQVMDAFEAPAQNGIVADRAGNIAIRSTGAFPLRPGDGLGTHLRDGSTRASDWMGYWPVERYPFARNPAQGFLASANQEPLDPRANAPYLGADWPPPWRAIRINALLGADSSVTVDDMRRFQTDPGSARADAFVPLLLAIGRARIASGGASRDLREAVRLLGQWDRRYTKDNERAVLFESVMSELESRAWDELEASAARSGRLLTPSSTILLELLHDSASAWWDNHHTPTIEHRDAVVVASLEAGLTRATRERGDPTNGGWRWDHVRHANIFHLLGIPTFSALDLPVQGGPSTLNPSSGSGRAGPSWRMVVQLGRDVRAWGIFPGGESGNPVSRRYTEHLEKWVNGELDELRFPRSPADLNPGVVHATLTLVPAP